MLCLYLSVLLAFAGCIHGAPLGSDFSFEVTDKVEFLRLPFGSSAVVNCNTTVPSTSVRLEKVFPRQPSHASSDQGKISQNGSLFTIHNIIVHDAGSYECIAEKNGQVIKRSITLTIDTSKPRMVIIPFKSRRVLIGSNLFYTCEATRGDIEWFKDEGPVPELLPSVNLLGVSIKSSYDGDIIRKDLVFKKVNFKHSGRYRCKQTYGHKTFGKIVQLSVLGPKAAIITEYSDFEIRVDKTQAKLELKCVADGFPPPRITWKKDDKVINDCSGQQGCRYFVHYDGLQIKRPRYPDDDANFSCEAQNTFGNDRKDFQVTVPVAPVLDKTVQQVYFWRDRTDLEIHCVLLKGNPGTNFSWLYTYCSTKKCQAWQDINKFPDKFKTIRGNKESQTTLRITGSRIPPFLKFKCSAENDEGSDSMVFKLMKESVGKG